MIAVMIFYDYKYKSSQNILISEKYKQLRDLVNIYLATYSPRYSYRFGAVFDEK